MASTPSQLRALYRSFLRELPHQPLSSPSPIKQRLRSTFSVSTESPKEASQEIEAAQQYLQYIKSQRLYATLLERYNPGMSMDEEERVRLTMRRVGMDAPKEWKNGDK